VKILITSNSHEHYDRVGKIIGKLPDGRYLVEIDDPSGHLFALVSEGQFKPTKMQD